MIKDVTVDTKIYRRFYNCDVRLKVKKVLDYKIVVEYIGEYVYISKDDVHFIDDKYYWV